MSVHQFINSLNIIRRSEHTNRSGALVRHLYWQVRKFMFPRPVRLILSRSIITDNEPGGVISLVNMLGRYDFNNMHLVQMALQRVSESTQAVFVDVGANIGAYTLIASELSQTKVVSLEPIPAAYAKLQHNIAVNRRSNVTALNVGASRRPGVLHMTCDGSSAYNQIVAEPGAMPTLAVEVDTLDAICARLNLVPTLLKIDVEGHEPEVLAGAERILRSCVAVLVENGDRPGIVNFMRECGLGGPFHYRHRTATMERLPQAVPEDQVFLGASFYDRFPEIIIETVAVPEFGEMRMSVRSQCSDDLVEVTSRIRGA